MSRNSRLAIVAVSILAGAVCAAAWQKPNQQNTNTTQNLQKPPREAATVLKPDLVVVSIDFKDFKVFKAVDGRNMGAVIPSFTIKNQGKLGSGSFKIAWEFYYPATNTQGPYLGQQFTQSLSAGQSWTQGGRPVDNCNKK